uniref:DDB1- and CUL4-associated factor 17 n=1 Tax=Denticeps clupeoides TaxID=299321 RepID=A0AAY4AYW3_9TELE
MSRRRPPAARRGAAVNACCRLDWRSRGICSRDAGVLLRENLKTLRHTILREDAVFEKVWTKSSRSPIAYGYGRIYFENYRCCYTSLQARPRLLYELPKRARSEKIEDVLICTCPLDQPGQRSSLLALTADNWLYRLCQDTGGQLQRVCLSAQHKFRYLGWDVPQERFYIKSIQHKPGRQGNNRDGTVLYLATFLAFPLKLVGVLEISSAAFGKTVVDAILSQGVLAVSHSSSCVKLYSFESILDTFRTQELVLGEPCAWNAARCVVGEPPLGIPVNIKVDAPPLALFEVNYLDNYIDCGVQIGGHPWHYIYAPKNKKHRGSYHVCSLRSGHLAKNGVQDMNCRSLESDWIYFHPDDSGRIIHVGPSTINVLKILNDGGGDAQSEVALDFAIKAPRTQNDASAVTVTSSGRTVRRRVQQLDDDPEQETFKSVEYEDELDLLAVVDITHVEEEGKANVRLHDNQNGALMKTVPLLESWDVTSSQDLFFDRDTIVHIEQEKNSNFCCHVYKIRSMHAEDQ